MIEDVAAALVRVDQCARGGADRERAVVAGSVAVVRMQDVEVGGVAGPQHPVGEDVRVGRAALARDRVHALDMLGAKLEQHLVDERDALVLTKAGPHRAVEVVVRGVDHCAGRVEQRDLVDRLDLACVLHERLPVDDGDAGLLQGEQHRQLDHVDADRLAEQAAQLELDADLLRDVFGTSFDRPAERRDARPRAFLAEPRAVELVVSRSRPEVPEDRLAVAGEKAESDELVHRPRPDVGRGDVADVRHVEAQKRPELRLLQVRRRPLQALFAEPVEVGPLLPVHRHRPE